MSLAEIMPAVQSLAHDEKVELMRLLASDLNQNERSATQTEAELLDQLVVAAQFEISRPGESYEAAAILSQLLESEKAKRR